MNRSLFGLIVAALATIASASSAIAIDPGVAISVSTWTSDSGHAYVGVQAEGQWAPPDETTTDVKTKYYTIWENQGAPNPNKLFWWVWVKNTIDHTTVNFDVAVDTYTTGSKPGIGIQLSTFGDMSLYLAVAVDPATAPARQPRTVSAQLTEGWVDALGDAIQAHVIHDSVHVTRWTVKFGDGAVQTFSPDQANPDQLSATHTYGTGSFDAVVTAHVVGQAYGAFFTPDGVPYERIAPFELDITNSASGAANLAVQYEPPIVFVGVSPSGRLADGTVIAPDPTGHQAISWPRGLHCALYVRAIVDQEGFMASGDTVVGNATTELVSYRYTARTNDATDATPSGNYPSDTPLAIQWDTPRPRSGTYPVQLVLELQTTYDDGTVRTSEAAGTVPLTVVYSAVSP